MIFLKTQRQFVVQFHEQSATNTTYKFMSVKFTKNFKCMKTIKVEEKD